MPGTLQLSHPRTFLTADGRVSLKAIRRQPPSRISWRPPVSMQTMMAARSLLRKAPHIGTSAMPRFSPPLERWSPTPSTAPSDGLGDS